MIRTGEALETQLAYIRETRADHGYSKAVNRLFDLVMSYITDAEDAHHSGRAAGGLDGGRCLVAAVLCLRHHPDLDQRGRAARLRRCDDGGRRLFPAAEESCTMVGAVLGEFYLRLHRTVKRLAVYNVLCEPLNIAWELLIPEGFDIFRVEGANRPNTADDGRARRADAELPAERNFARPCGVAARHGRSTRRTCPIEIRRFNRLFGKVRRSCCCASTTRSTSAALRRCIS